MHWTYFSPRPFGGEGPGVRGLCHSLPWNALDVRSFRERTCIVEGGKRILSSES